MNEGNHNFERVLSKKDIIALAFGAMIGWGWVVLTGEWIMMAGTLGAILGFVFGGIMVLFVGLIYAELTSAMPQCGGEHVFSYRALGEKASFFCTWAIVLGYISVVAFEAVAFPTVIEYLFPAYLKGYMYSVASYDIYFTWVIVGSVSSIIITFVNYIGVKPAAFFQGIATIMILIVGLMLFTGAIFSGHSRNITPLFSNGKSGILAVTLMTPFLYVGFDVIPQAAEEINVPFNTIGKIIILSLVMAIAWYTMMIYSTSVGLSYEELSQSKLATADAMKNIYNSPIASKIIIIGGIGGILTSWNSFFVGGSRAIYAMAESKMLPSFLAKFHPKYKTPVNAILLIGLISTLSPLLGRRMLVWLTNAGSLGIVNSYLMVSISFLVLRRKEPNLDRPYKVKYYKLVGIMAIILCSAMIILYLPGQPSSLIMAEWAIVIGWIIFGIILYTYTKIKNRKANLS